MFINAAVYFYIPYFIGQSIPPVYGVAVTIGVQIIPYK